MSHMKYAPTRKLSDALFRGKDTEHSFKVYPLKAAITDQPAVFIISRRITDRYGRGHHVAVCIGETESTQAELKKHKRASCVKDHGANVVCLLRERDIETRLDVIADLTAHRSFSCIRNKYKPKMNASNKHQGAARKSNAKTTVRNLRPRSGNDSRRSATAPETGTRVQGRMDRDSGQHRLSNQKRIAARKAKGGTPRVSRSGKKAAA